MSFSRFYSVRPARSSPRPVVLLGLALLLGIITGSFLPGSAAAQTSEELELINEINGLRASRGLSAYTVDPALMAMAQEHSAYQASIHTSTHLHSDGRNPPQLGVVENVAGGDLGYLTPQSAIYDIWVQDAGHLKTMVGFTSGAMGVGIADDGETSYYTLEVRPGEGPAVTNAPTKPGTTHTPITPIPIVALVTMTARPDGSIVHVVGYGQTLWSIAQAYGVTVEQIRAWNNLPEGSSEIYAGQKLLVWPVSLVTFVPTADAAAAASPAPETANPGAASPMPSPQVTASPTEAAARLAAPVTQIAAAAPTTPVKGPSLLQPLLAAVSILIGFALLFLLLPLRRTH